jgi:hypothetical protein
MINVSKSICIFILVKMKLAIVGTRTFCDYGKMEDTLEGYKDRITEIISGGAQVPTVWRKSMPKITKFLFVFSRPIGKHMGKERVP